MDKDIDSMVEGEIERSNEAFYAFTDKIVTLSTGALTLSIIFRNSLTGNQPPTHLWLLQVSWIGFMLAVLTGTLWYLSKYRVHRDMAEKLRTNRSGSTWEFVGPKWYYRLARKVMMWSFPIAIVALTLFGILNIR
jgi:hypothetical protein